MRYLLIIALLGLVGCDRGEFGGRKAGGEYMPQEPNTGGNNDSDQNNSAPVQPGDNYGENNDSGLNNEAPPVGEPAPDLGVWLVDAASEAGFAELGSHRDNVIYSPFSTAQKLAAASVLNNQGTQDAENMLELAASLQDPTLFFETSVWFQTGLRSQDADRLAGLVAIRTVDFTQQESARQQINNYYRDVSSGLVTTALSSPLAAETQVGLVDVSFFSDTWTQPFDQSRTASATFAGFTGNSEVQMMEVEGTFVNHQTDAWKTVILPYSSGAKLFVIIPEDGEFDNVQPLLSPSFLAAEEGRASAEYLMVRLPKVELDQRINEEAYAELSSQFQSELGEVSTAQRATLSFSEMHTVATSETDAGDPGVGETPPSNDLLMSVDANRPFFWAIRAADERTVLMQGQVGAL